MLAWRYAFQMPCLSSHTQVLWEAWRQQMAAVTAGPISASKFSTVHVAFQVDPLAQPGTVTLYERYRPLDGSFPMR